MKRIAIIALAAFGLTQNVDAADVEAGAQTAQTCAACHQADGNSTTPIWPKLAGQNPDYLVKQLKDFQAGMADQSKGRFDPSMSPMAAPLSVTDMENVAAYYGSRDIQKGAVAKEYLKTGEALYRGGDASRGIPACTACHGPTGAGLNAAEYPALAGQHPEYTIAQLKAFAKGTRHNDQNRVMRDIASRMSDEQMEAVAHYLLGLH